MDKQPLVISYLRFSSKDQQSGDSIRRQVEARDRWLAKKGWEADDSIRDEGVSAYRGGNAATGALGRIIKLIDNGTIPKGSYLIVEHLDRLSRDEIFAAVELFWAIIRRGIVVVSLSDDLEYSKETINTNPNLVMFLVMNIVKSNEDSKRKSVRVGAAWKNKRKGASDGSRTKAITRMVPNWLKVNAKGIIEPVPDKVAIVQEIFDLALKGRGRNWICKHLNQKYDGKGLGTKPWSDTYILSILRSRTVLGEYQPHKLVYDDHGKKKRERDGDPIEGYYPRIIDEQTYYAVQKAIENRRRSGGPVSDTVINFWQGIMYDRHDFRYISKSSNQWRRYYISSRRDGRGGGEEGDVFGDKVIAFPADQFDFAVLVRLVDLELHGPDAQASLRYQPTPNGKVEKLDVGKVMGTTASGLITQAKEKSAALSPLARQADTPPALLQLQAVEARMNEIETKLTALQEALATKPLVTLIKVVEKLEMEKAELERQRYNLLAEAATPRKGLGQMLADWFLSLEDVLHGRIPPEKRLALRESIRRQVKRITALVGKAEDCQRDYVASLRVVLHDWAGQRLGAEIEELEDGTKEYVVHIAFRLDYIDYRDPNHNKENPYTISWMVDA